MIQEDIIYVFVVTKMTLHLIEHPSQEECIEMDKLHYLVKIYGFGFHLMTNIMPNIELTYTNSCSSGHGELTNPGRGRANHRNIYFELDVPVVNACGIRTSHNDQMVVKARLFNSNGDACMHAEHEIQVIHPYITKFKHKATKKDWKVVMAPVEIGDFKFDDHSKIIHDVYVPKYCDGFNWGFALGDNNQVVWTLKNNTNKSGDEMYIPNENAPEDKHWDYFGDKFGVVCVAFHDNTNNKQNYVLCSDKGMLPKKYDSYRKITMNPSKRAKVFFHKRNRYSKFYKIPNWFYYWKEIIEYDKDQIKDLKWLPRDHSICEEIAAGSLVFKYGKPNAPIHTTYVCDYVSNEIDREGLELCDKSITNIKVPESKGIECFYTTLKHEQHHYEIFDRLWGKPYDMHYNIVEDASDIDKFPDSWEKTHKTLKGIPFEVFNVSRNEGPKGYISTINGKRLEGNGYGYDCFSEPECIGVENKLTKEKYNKYDWSYELSKNKKEIQGKNWEKK